MAREYKTVRGLLRNRERWTKDHYFKQVIKKDGRVVNSYCLSGACRAVYGDHNNKFYRALDRIIKAIGELHPQFLDGRSRVEGDVIIFNDHERRRHKDILKVVQKARV